MLVTFGLPVSVQFTSYPWFIHLITWFLRQYFASVLLCASNVWGWVFIDCLSQCPWSGRTCYTNKGGGGSYWWQKILPRCAHEIIMVCNLLHQADAWYWDLFQIPVPWGTWEEISTDHAGVWPRDCDWDPTVNPSMHVKNGFVHIFCHELTQTREYVQGLFSRHTTKRKNKRRKNLLLVEVLTVLSFFCFFRWCRSLFIGTCL